MIAAGTLEVLQESVVRQLERRLTGVRVFGGFCREQFFGRVEQPMMSVQVHQVRTQSMGLDDYFGGGRDGALYREWRGELAQVTMRFVLFVPLGSEMEASAVFLTICQALRKLETPFAEFVCGETVFLDKAQCFQTAMNAVGSLLITDEEEAAVISEIRLKAAGTGGEGHE